jgi:hypothetical protein
MKGKAEIIVMRGFRHWKEAVPELADYKNLHHGANPRTPYMTPGNLKEKNSYATIAQRLCTADSST